MSDVDFFAECEFKIQNDILALCVQTYYLFKVAGKSSSTFQDLHFDEPLYVLYIG